MAHHNAQIDPFFRRKSKSDENPSTSYVEESRSRGQRDVDVDVALAEGVDFSEGGWATDFAASLIALLFFVSALLFYENDEEDMHWVFMYLGTCIAHCFGGLAHRYFPNRANDGVGFRGFYFSMMLGYGGNCMRYGLGWFGVEGVGGEYLRWIALGNFVYLVLTGVYAMFTITPTDSRLNDGAEGMFFLPDFKFGLGEAFCSFMEVVSTIIYVVPIVNDWSSGNSVLSTEAFVLVIVACVSNLVGWVAVYVPALFYTLCQFNYNPNLMQRIFHYSMIMMLWCLDSHVRASRYF
mmetsp:Transcript_9605/g.14093  ORF Transcript_9605/g.14093 Transcript_9605/m.14093 type:complete len:293 (-) Transcript_9605:111-989(-)